MLRIYQTQAGAILTVAFASRQEELYTIDELLALYTHPNFIIYFLFTSGLIVVWLLFIRRIEVLYDAAADEQDIDSSNATTATETTATEKYVFFVLQAKQ
jgi:hypothetical protein